MSLFEKLRILRREIASEEHIPPYMVFTDKTLKEMSMKLPDNGDKMLKISGVGENKYNKYAKRFIEKIKEFILDNDIHIVDEDVSNSYKVKTKREKKSEFRITEDMEGKIQYCKPMYLTEFVRQLNLLRNKSEMKVVDMKSLGEELVLQGYLYSVEEDGKNYKRPTEKGIENGIYTQTRVSEYGNEYKVVYYNEIAQKIIVEILKRKL